MVVEFASAIVGLAAIGAQVGKVVYNLIETLHDAPKELLALSDEITDFRAILLHLIEAQGSREFASQGLVGDLEGVTRKCEAILRDIERHVQSVVKEKGIPAGSLEVSRIRWLHRVKKAQKLQQALRVQKATISNFLAIGVVYVPLRLIFNRALVTGVQEVERHTWAPDHRTQDSNRFHRSIPAVSDGEAGHYAHSTST